MTFSLCVSVSNVGKKVLATGIATVHCFCTRTARLAERAVQVIRD